MKAIEGAKYVDKICPLFPPIPTKRPIAMQPGPFGGLIELTMTLTTCQKERCQLWDVDSKDCSHKRNSPITDAIYALSVSIEECLNHINYSIRDHLKEKHGNS